MPLSGTLEPDPSATRPRLATFAAPTIELLDVDVLQVSTEIKSSGRQELLPGSMHPTNPPIAFVQIFAVQGGDLGKFNLALVKIGARLGTTARGFLVASYCDDATAASALREHWAIDCHEAQVELEVGYDRVRGTVEASGAIIDVVLADPEPLAPSQVVYSPVLVPAETPLGLRLVEVEPEYVTSRADRGKTRVDVLEGSRFGAPALHASWPVAATFARSTVSLGDIRATADWHHGKLEPVDSPDGG